MTPPLAVDIDGTLTGPNRGLDPQVIPALREWDAPLVFATGKSFAYPVALCEFLALSPVVIAENGGAVYVEATDEITYAGDPEAAAAVAEAYRDVGHDLGWGAVDFVNRWRETELAVSRESPLEPLTAIAADHGLEVVDTGFAYHVKPPDVSKGHGLELVAGELDLDPAAFVAIGDSENDVSTFKMAGQAIAVANADDAARAAADEVTDERYGDGFLEAIEGLQDA